MCLMAIFASIAKPDGEAISFDSVVKDIEGWTVHVRSYHDPVLSEMTNSTTRLSEPLLSLGEQSNAARQPETQGNS